MFNKIRNIIEEKKEIICIFALMVNQSVRKVCFNFVSVFSPYCESVLQSTIMLPTLQLWVVRLSADSTKEGNRSQQTGRVWMHSATSGG